ncbi:MAG TPA: thymidine kinase [Firmicutes bacterium]|nr:thymidine kinase [Bacillota bacterium]
MYQELQKGWIEVITGPMFAGKSEELIRRITTLSYANKHIVAFKPVIDNRYDRSKIATHAGKMYSAHAITCAAEITKYVTPETEVVAIDEVQFFDDSIVDICDDLADRGIRVICAGLDMDFTGKPFGPMGQLLCKAEIVTKLEAACTVCGCGATRSQRLIDGKPARSTDPIVMVGADEKYEARCRKHHQVDR